MSDAVAKLRFDLLANLGGFTEPMRQAGDVAEKQMTRFNRAFDSAKAAADRAQKGTSAWRDAMQKEGSFLAASMKFEGGGGGISAAAQKRFADSLPWGQAGRIEISKQGAETKAAIEREARDLEAKLSNGKIFNAAGHLIDKVPGLGDAMDLAGDVAKNPLGLPAAAAFGAYELNRRNSEQMRERARTAMHTGSVLGTDVETASRLNAVGFDESLGSRFQESLHERKTAFADIGLNADNLQAKPFAQALEEVGQALKNVQNPTDRAAAAMEIFGRSGAEVIPVLTGLKQKLDDVAQSDLVTADKADHTRQYDAAKKENARAYDEVADKASRYAGADEGFGTAWEHTKGAAWTMAGGSKEDLEHYFERTQNASDRAAKAAVNDRFKNAPNAVGSNGWYAQQQAIQKQNEELLKKQQAEARAGIEAGELSAGSGLAGQIGADRWGNQSDEALHREVRKHAQVLGHGAFDQWTNDEIDRQDEMVNQGRLAGTGWSLAKSGQSAMDRDAQNQEAIAAWKAHVAPGRKDAAEQLGRMNRSADRELAAGLGVRDPQQEYADRLADLLAAKGRFSAEKLHRAAADAADALTSALDQPFATAIEKFDAHMKEIDKHEKDGSYTRDEAARRRKAETEGELSHAGIKRPLDEFSKSMEELAALRDKGKMGQAGGITQEEYDQRERELRTQAISGTLSGKEEIHAVAAMAAGSKEAYSAQVSARLNDPRMALMQQTNTKLDALVKAAEAAATRQAIMADPAAAWQ